MFFFYRGRGLSKILTMTFHALSGAIRPGGSGKVFVLNWAKRLNASAAFMWRDI